AGREHRVRVTDRSLLAGKSLVELNLHDTAGARLVAVERNQKLIQPSAKTELRAGDVLFVDLVAPGVDAATLRQKFALDEMPLSGAYFTDRSQEIGMAEVILPASSDLIGKTVVGAEFRTRYGLTVIGLRRGGAAHECGLLNEELKVGDTLLLIGPWKAIENLQSDGRDLGI